MLLLLICVLLWVMGIFLYFVTAYLFPIFYIVYMDWIAIIIIMLPTVICLMRMNQSKTYKYADFRTLGRTIVNYLRRDYEIAPVFGKRIYSGESFLDIPGLGLIEDLGKGTVYSWAGKKTRWALENLNFTPDPKYANFTHELYELGFNDERDVYNVLNGYDLLLMGKIYLKMQERLQAKHGAVLLVDEMKRHIPRKRKFGLRRKKPKEVIKEGRYSDAVREIERL